MPFRRFEGVFESDITAKMTEAYDLAVDKVGRDKGVVLAAMVMKLFEDDPSCRPQDVASEIIRQMQFASPRVETS